MALAADGIPIQEGEEPEQVLAAEANRSQHEEHYWPRLFSDKSDSLPFVGDIKRPDVFEYALLRWFDWRFDIRTLGRFVKDIFSASGSIERKGRIEAENVLTAGARHRARVGGLGARFRAWRESRM